MRGKEVLGKVVGKSGGETSREEKRESLKKRIVVVGITDQSPGMLSACDFGVCDEEMLTVWL